MKSEEVLLELKSHGDPSAVKGMASFGISSVGTLGVSMPTIRAIAKRVGRDHALAEELWESAFHEAKILAALVDIPGMVTESQMERWVASFDSWDVCDQCCSNLFDKTEFAYSKATEWSKRKEEFVKRAGYALMASLAVHDKRAQDPVFEGFLRAIREGATDERNFVKKAVNWALRQIGKRNLRLNGLAISLAKDLQRSDSKAARWVGSDAVRELSSGPVKKKIRRSS